MQLRRAALVVVGLVASLTASAAETLEYIHTDAMGSPVAVTDENGVVIRRTEYEPYGAVIGGEVADGPGYTGHVSDSATGLSYMQQRYMDPELGVFLSVDPVTAHQEPVVQFSRYRYANGNPYWSIDPDGRRACGKDTTCRLEQGDSGGTSLNRGSAPQRSSAASGNSGPSAQRAYGRPVHPSDPAWTRDERILGQMEGGWQESNPFAPPVRRGLPGSLKREQGGWVIRPYGTGRPELHRTSPGTRDRMGYDVVIRPNEFECGCVIVGFYHTHPNTREEGYGPNANRGDYNFLYYIGVPGMIRSHSGYEYVPLPEGK